MLAEHPRTDQTGSYLAVPSYEDPGLCPCFLAQPPLPRTGAAQPRTAFMTNSDCHSSFVRVRSRLVLHDGCASLLRSSSPRLSPQPPMAPSQYCPSSGMRGSPFLEYKRVPSRVRSAVRHQSQLHPASYVLSGGNPHPPVDWSQVQAEGLKRTIRYLLAFY